MNQPDFRREWKRAPFFHETAEALGITTMQVIAVVQAENVNCFVAFYTEEGRSTKDDPVLSVVLAHGLDGILSPISKPTLHPNLWEALGMEEDDRPSPPPTPPPPPPSA